jgi:hypothetical protein
MSQGSRRLIRSQKLYPLSYGRLVLKSFDIHNFLSICGANREEGQAYLSSDISISMSKSCLNAW